MDDNNKRSKLTLFAIKIQDKALIALTKNAACQVKRLVQLNASN